MEAQKPDPILEKYYTYQKELIEKHGMPKLGRWTYCKYCYKSVIPRMSFKEGLIQCSRCGAGLAPLDEVIKLGSLESFNNKIESDFVRFNIYLDQVKNGLKDPNGLDDLGKVPYICEKCKKEQATVFSKHGDLCNNCHPRP